MLLCEIFVCDAPILLCAILLNGVVLFENGVVLLEKLVVLFTNGVVLLVNGTVLLTKLSNGGHGVPFTEAQLGAPS